MMKGAAVSIEGLRKHYRGSLVPALDGLSLTVPEGSIFGLLGPNGAGKTTTISILSGIIKADSGMVALFGVELANANSSVWRRIGLVPQSIALYPSLTGWETIQYIGRLYGLDSESISKRGTELLERLGLTTHAGKRVSRYSGGMKRRMNIIASLLHEPELLILDEPTAGVDVQSRALILSFLRDYNKGGKTILYTSHHLDEAEQLCQQICIVDEGRAVISGAPTELIMSTQGSSRLEDVFLHYTGHALRD